MHFIQDDLNEDLWNDWLEFEIEQVIPLILEYTVMEQCGFASENTGKRSGPLLGVPYLSKEYD
jgi:hypothetical protein